eukprot:262375-Rhodomonas_salina.1
MHAIGPLSHGLSVRRAAASLREEPRSVRRAAVLMPCTPKSNTRNRIPGSNCTESAGSCLEFRGGGHLDKAAPRNPRRDSSIAAVEFVPESRFLVRRYTVHTVSALERTPVLWLYTVSAAMNTARRRDPKIKSKEP